MPIYRFGEDTPHIPQSAYISPEATVIGKVTLGECASVWPNAVIRGDDDTISVGDNTNIQDCAVLHVDPGCPMTIGANVTVGHQATLHGCTVGDGTLVGLQAIVYNKAIIGKDCLIAAGAIITEGKVFPDRSLIVGAPAKLHREVTENDLEAMRVNVNAYVQRGLAFKTKLSRIG